MEFFDVEEQQIHEQS